MSDAGKMVKSTEASLFHVASTDNLQHHLCPEGEEGSCG